MIALNTPHAGCVDVTLECADVPLLRVEGGCFNSSKLTEVRDCVRVWRSEGGGGMFACTCNACTSV
jgi:hypothetical protein